MILYSGLSMELPGDAYLCEQSGDTQYWSSPAKNLLIGMSEIPFGTLNTWYATLKQTSKEPWFAESNGVRMLLCDEADDFGKHGMVCYVNELNHTYLITSADMTVDEKVVFESLLATMQSISTYDRHLVLPTSLKVIEQDAFTNCAAEVVVIPSGCRAIGACAFSSSASIRYIHIPASVSAIAEDAFAGCNALTIIAPADSEAIRFAMAQDIPYIVG